MSYLLIKTAQMTPQHINKLLICFFLFSSFYVFAQSPSKKQYLEKAEAEFADKNYYGALIYYNEALEFDQTDAVVLFKSAEAARQFNAYSKAAAKYQFLIDSLKDTSKPEAIFWLANMNQRMGQYDNAQNYYNIYLSEFSGQDSILTIKAKKELASLDFAKNLVKNQRKNVKFERLGDDVNTTASEVAANMYDDVLFYTSMNYKEQNPLVTPPREISKLLKKQKDSTAVLLPGTINEKNNLVANSAITSDGQWMYYTICDYINGSEITCELYRRKLDASGNLLEETKLPDPINLPSTTTTHPHLSKDKISGKEILYFVSNRPGGKGGLDIWYSLLDPKFGFSEPINVSEINTADDEITPFYNTKSDFLYFSSDGREGLGGFDVYKAGKTNDAFGSVIHVGIPVNSSYNDIFYHEVQSGDQAYVSSNRQGSLFLDSYFESCCYDIYQLDIKKVDLDLNALTFDKLTGRPLKKATVILIDKDTGMELARVTTDDGNEHKFPLIDDKNYLIIAERENYYPDTIELSTIGIDSSMSITKKMYLKTDMMLLDVFTFTKIGKLPLSGTTVTLIDLSNPSIKEIVEFNPLSNDFYFMLDRGKQYKLIATKDDYTEAIDSVDTRPFDKSGLLRKDLYLDKFVLQDLLPIALFFDNDLPDITSKKTTTKSKYGDLVSAYLSRKQVYKDKFIKPLTESEKSIKINDYETFFEGDVSGGYDKFEMFLGNLLFELQAGNKVELIIKGFASPRADSKYNLALGQRRVNSVKNQMMTYNNEVLKPYFKSGQLVMTDISFGKELAPPDVEGNIKDERNSIYNLKAAKERRVEILRASRNNQ